MEKDKAYCGTIKELHKMLGSMLEECQDTKGDHQPTSPRSTPYWSLVKKSREIEDELNKFRVAGIEKIRKYFMREFNASLYELDLELIMGIVEASFVEPEKVGVKHPCRKHHDLYDE